MLEEKLEMLKDQIIESMYLVRGQLAKAKTALKNKEEGFAQEVIHYENRVNATELGIDRDVESILTLYHPVGIELRFILAVLKINSHLERIGDHAEAIAKYALLLKSKLDIGFLNTVLYDKLFDLTISMLDDAANALNFEDPQLARQIFIKEKKLQDLNQHLVEATKEAISKGVQEIQELLYLFSSMRKIERCGNLTKNIAEETIFYIEAKVLRHADKRKKTK